MTLANIKSRLSVERVVVLFTPLFATASAWVTGVVATIVPGAPPMNAGDVTALEIAGAAAAIAGVLKWLHGRAAFVKDTAYAKHELELAKAKVAEIAAANPAAGAALADIEALFRAHEISIEQAIEAQVPKSIAVSLAAVFGQLGAGAIAQVPFPETRIVSPAVDQFHATTSQPPTNT